MSGTETVNDTLLPLIKADSTFYAQDLTNNEVIIGTVGDTLTFDNDCYIIYEFALTNKGIANNQDAEYTAYRDYVNWCKEQIGVYFNF